MNKRKILVLTMVLSMVAILAAGATLAYFTDTDEATNVFTVGNVDIELVERMEVTDEDGKTKLAEWEEQAMVPVSENDAFANVNKLVSVKNVGTNDAYVRVKMKHQKVLDEVLALVPAFNGGTNSWYNKTTTEVIDGIEYTVFTIELTQPVTAGTYYTGLDASNELTDYFTGIGCALVTGVALRDTFDWVDKDNGKFSYVDGNQKVVVDGGTTLSFDVIVVAEAIQKDGFDSREAAWAAFAAQNPAN